MLLDFYDKVIQPGEVVRAEHFNSTDNSNTTNYFLYDYKDNSKYPFLFILDHTGNVDFNNRLNCKVDNSVSLIKTHGWKWVRLGAKEDVLKELFIRKE